MNPASVESSYRRALKAAGEAIILRRYSGTGEMRTHVDYGAVARVNRVMQTSKSDVEPGVLAGGMMQDAFVVIVLASDLEAAGLTGAPKTNDKVVVRGKELNVESADGNNRSIQGTTIAWEIAVRG